MASNDELLAQAILTARRTTPFRSLFGTVTALSGTDYVYLKPDATDSATMGPLYVVTGKAKVNDRLMATYLPDNKVWVAWGAAAAGTTDDLVLVWTGLGYPGARITYRRRTAGAWGATAYLNVPDGADYELIAGPSVMDNDDIPIASTTGWSTVELGTNFYGFMNNFPQHHRVVVLDGGWLVAFAYANNGVERYDATHYRTRAPGASGWSAAGTIFGMGGESEDDTYDYTLATARNSIGNIVYVAGHQYSLADANTRAVVFRMVHNGDGTFVITKVRLSGGSAGFQSQNALYYDTTNDLLHAWVEDDTTAFGSDPIGGVLYALDSTTLAVRYSASLPMGSRTYEGGDRSQLSGDGTAAFFATSSGGSSTRVARVSASASAYSIVDENPPAFGGGGSQFTSVYAGGLVLFLVSNTGLRMCERTAVDTYGAWTLMSASYPAAGYPDSVDSMSVSRAAGDVHLTFVGRQLSVSTAYGIVSIGIPA